MTTPAPKQSAVRRRRLGIVVAVILLTIALLQIPYGAHAVEPANVSVTQPTVVDSLDFDWPSRGAAAIGTLSGGLKAKHGAERRYPTASIAKTITVLVILDRHPLASGETGPMLTMDEGDVQRYQATLARGGSNLPVTAGEQLSLRDLLTGIMLKSANNLADSAAIWAFGSLDGYRTAATQWLSAHQLTQTTIGSDASGLDPQTTSTVEDLFTIGTLAASNETLSQITGLASADFPGVGLIENTNRLVAQEGYSGIKTGQNLTSGFCLLFSFDYELSGHRETVIGVVLGQATEDGRFTAAQRLAASARTNLSYDTIVAGGGEVVRYDPSWTGPATARATDTVSVLRWKDEPVTVTVDLPAITSPLKAGEQVGTISAAGQSTTVVLADSLPSPRLWWWLTQEARGS